MDPINQSVNQSINQSETSTAALSQMRNENETRGTLAGKYWWFYHNTVQSIDQRLLLHHYPRWWTRSNTWNTAGKYWWFYHNTVQSINQSINQSETSIAPLSQMRDENATRGTLQANTGNFITTLSSRFSRHGPHLSSTYSELSGPHGGKVNENCKWYVERLISLMKCVSTDVTSIYLHCSPALFPSLATSRI